ncbi:MAG TPA: YlxR family protein [Oscillospiraceae bacterium]|nr:YlxR family protein [Oscillospiraceae bacterium]
MAVRKTPLRKCTGCGEMKPKTELIRIVRSSEGAINLNLTGKASGRGAYICKNRNCLKLAHKARRLEKAFSCAIPNIIYEEIEGELNNLEL